MFNTLIGIALFAWAPFLSVVVGVLYFVCSDPAAPLTGRVVSAAYAPSAAIIYLVVAFSTPAVRDSYLKGLYPAVIIVPLTLLALSLARYPGPRWAHIVLIPIALVCLLWQGAWGYWGIYGK
jgi:hypothetical protein